MSEPLYIKQRDKIDNKIKTLKKKHPYIITKGKYEGIIGYLVSWGDYKANLKVDSEIYSRYGCILTVNILWIEEFK